MKPHPTHAHSSRLARRIVASTIGSEARKPGSIGRPISAPVLRWLYARRRMNQSFDVAFGSELQRTYDEWDALGVQPQAAGRAVHHLRRGLHHAGVQIDRLAESLDEPSAFEVLLEAQPGGNVTTARSDRAGGRRDDLGVSERHRCRPFVRPPDCPAVR